MDKLKAISVFCKVVETQSFTQTAEYFHISVAMVSKLVQQLESSLEARLLQRSTRKVIATEIGNRYYQRCLSILTDLNDIENDITQFSGSLSGTLNISVPIEFGTSFIAPNLPHFLQQHPKLKVNIEFSDRYVDLIAEGVDLALRIGKLEDSSLIAKKLAQSSLHFVASPLYLAQHSTPTTPEQLAQHSIAVHRQRGQYIYWQTEHSPTMLKQNIRVVSNNGVALVKMAKAGLGIINIPHFFIQEELKNGELVEILADYPQQKIDIHAVYPNKRHLPAKVRSFLTFLQGIIQ